MNEPAITKSFEERMFEQIKSQMGDLLTQEELGKILETAIDKAFFQDRIVKSGYSTDVKEPLFVEMIRRIVGGDSWRMALTSSADVLDGST